MTEFPAYKTVSTSSLVPYARNSRTHSDAQVSKIAASIKEFGFLNPIIADGENGIIAGHGRVLAAQKLGLDTLPVVEAGHLTDAQRKAYIIADNRLALDAGWDNDMLKVELSDLDAQGFDLALTGFDLGEITVIFDEPDFAPGTEDDQGKLDELAPKMVTCPHCAAEWDLREHGQG
jgi:ParB-like chromosome segregation protein Spo0J